MLPAAELRCLSLWCRRHGVSWSPARTDDGTPALLLALPQDGAAWPPLLLVEGHEGWRLIDGCGDQVATASRLGLLLDALDGGVAGHDAVERPRTAARWPSRDGYRGAAIAAPGPAPRPDAARGGW